MPKFHVSQDGLARVCKAQSSDSCTASGPDGEAAPHGDFDNPKTAQRFAESAMESAMNKQQQPVFGQSASRAPVQMGTGIDDEYFNQERPATKANKPYVAPTPDPEDALASSEAKLAALKENPTRYFDDNMNGTMDYYNRVAELDSEINSAKAVLNILDKESRPEYIASIDKKHFGQGGAGSKFTDTRARNVAQLMSLTQKSRKQGLKGDDREQLIIDGANPKDFAPKASGICYLRVPVEGRQMLKSTADMADDELVEVRAKGGNDGRPASLTFAAAGGSESVKFATVVIGPKIDAEKKAYPWN